MGIFFFPDTRVSPNLDISRIGARIIDELVMALKDVNIDDTELACIKALVFFDPSKFCLFKIYLETASKMFPLKISRCSRSK